MGNNTRTTKQIKDKVLALMKLALEYNRNNTEQKLTEDRPSFFVEFFPHTCELDVGVHIGISRCIEETIHLAPRFSDDTGEEVLAALDRWVDLFTSLYFGWRCAERVNIHLESFKGIELEDLLLDEYKGTELEGLLLDEQ